MTLIRSYPPNFARCWRRIIRAFDQHVALFEIILHYALQAGKIEL
jgi:hypothetical protein